MCLCGSWGLKIGDSGFWGTIEELPHTAAPESVWLTSALQNRATADSKIHSVLAGDWLSGVGRRLRSLMLLFAVPGESHRSGI